MNILAFNLPPQRGKVKNEWGKGHRPLKSHGLTSARGKGNHHSCPPLCLHLGDETQQQPSEQIDILDSWRTGSLLPILLPTSRARNRGAAACCGAEGWVAAAVLRAEIGHSLPPSVPMEGVCLQSSFRQIPPERPIPGASSSLFPESPQIQRLLHKHG